MRTIPLTLLFFTALIIFVYAVDSRTELLAADAPATPATVGKTYYIALNGAAGAPGTLEKPFATYRQANAVLRAGDCLYYRAGVYTDPATFIAHTTRLDGAAGERITIKPRPGEKVVFDNLNRGGGLATLPGNGVIVEGFEFRNSHATAPKPENALKAATIRSAGAGSMT
jgi:hypothetical protein